MRRTETPLPARSGAYPLYDLALIGWLLGAVPIVASIVSGRPHVAAIAVGVCSSSLSMPSFWVDVLASPSPATSIAARVTRPKRRSR